MEEEYGDVVFCGKGAFAEVFQAKNPSTGERVAIKKIDLFPNETGLSEVVILAALEHENIVRFIDHCYDDTKRCLTIVMEFVATNLHKVIYEDKLFTNRDLAFDYFVQILRGVAFFHEHGVVHCDIKPENILVSNTGKIKIGDFGTAIHSDNPIPHTQYIVTRWYRAPELLIGCETFTNAIDIWSLGCVYFEMVFGSVMFPGRDPTGQALEILCLLGKPTPESWPAFYNTKHHDKIPNYECHGLYKIPKIDNTVFYGLLKLNPDNRLSAEDALEALTLDVVSD